MKLLLALAAPLALAACITVYPPDEPKGDAVASARLGETVRVGPTRVTPRMLIEDSRCPSGVRCVWAGRVRISAEVDGAARELTAGQPITVGRGALTLTNVRPPRIADIALRPADYVFELRFAG